MAASVGPEFKSQLLPPKKMSIFSVKGYNVQAGKKKKHESDIYLMNEERRR
jgi:hypothetical protein